MSGYGGWNNGLRSAAQTQGKAAIDQNQSNADKLSTQLDTLRGIYNPSLVSNNVQASSNAANKLALNGGYNSVTPTAPDLSGRGREVYQNFSETGGYTPEQSSAFIRSATLPTEAIYNRANDQLYRQRALQGGYMPGFDASTANITRDTAKAGADAQLGAQTNLQDIINRNKSAGASGLEATRAAAGSEALGQTELGVQQESNTQRGLIAGQQALQNFNQFGAAGITQADMMDLQNRAQTGSLSMADAQLLQGLAQESPALLQSLISAVPGILSALTSKAPTNINVTGGSAQGGQGGTGTGGQGGRGGDSTSTNTNNPTSTATAIANGTNIPSQPPQPNVPPPPPTYLPGGANTPPFVNPPGNPPTQPSQTSVNIPGIDDATGVGNRPIDTTTGQPIYDPNRLPPGFEDPNLPSPGDVPPPGSYSPFGPGGIPNSSPFNPDNPFGFDNPPGPSNGSYNSFPSPSNGGYGPTETFSYANSAALPSYAYMPEAMQAAPETLQSSTSVGPSNIDDFIRQLYGIY